MFRLINLYRLGAAALKRDRTAENLAERFIPAELMQAERVSITGAEYMLVENHRGILEYGSECIIIAVQNGKITISGTGLSLGGMNRDELVIKGRIQTVEWEKA